ncbi:MAG TPA: iron-sulfur cluster assembly accessory protein [Actinomycetota bacterium]
MDTAVIAVTDAASRKARELADRQGTPAAALRIRVTAGGCSGFSYELAFDAEPATDDLVVTATDGFRVLIDPRSAPILQGSTLDFDDALMGGGLKIRNPQVTHECACGDSFSV